jgi:hypothetical protein
MSSFSQTYSITQHYPPDQLVDELLRCPGWFASSRVTNPVYYSYLTATRMEDMENVEFIDIFTTIYGTQ